MLFYNRLQHPPAVTKRVQFALTVNTRMLKTGNFSDFKVGFVHTEIDQGLDLETITVNFHMVEAVLPEGVVAVAQVTEPC